MQKIPVALLESLNIPKTKPIEDWWNQIPEKQQVTISKIYKETEIENVFVELTAAILGEEIIQDENEIFLEDMRGMYDYLVNHEVPVYTMPRQMFGICRLHNKARKVIKEGQISCDFICPLKNENCKMREIVNHFQGDSVKLYLRIYRKVK